MDYEQSELANLLTQVEGLKKDLADAKQKYRGLRSRRSVRIALGIAQFATPLLRLVHWFRPPPRHDLGTSETPPRSSFVERAPSRRAQSRVAKRITATRSGANRSSGPLVSIVVLTRDGADHLKRLLERLERTLYQTFEVIVIDNASTDSTEDVLGAQRPFSLHVIRNDRNVSFSEGNNQGAEAANGDYLLFLNNDVEPINPGWLGAMVDAVQDGDDVVASSAVLIYPARGEATSDLTVQHGGIHFSFRNGAVRAFNTGASDPLKTELAKVIEVPAATAAALMVQSVAFHKVGGFDRRYVYGREDVDLCLKLRNLGRIVVTGQAVLFHYESATLSQLATDVREVNRAKNRQLFAEIWAPRLTRSVMRDRLTGAGQWIDSRPRTVAITLTRDDIDAGWGDYYTAHELGDAFASAGWRVVYAERYDERWYEMDGEIDLLVSLLDSYDVRLAPEGAFTVAWVRNWADRWLEQPWFEKYDLVTVSSHKAAELLSLGSRFRPSLVPMATNLERFHPGQPNPHFESEYVFTGSNWGQGRDVIRFLDINPDERFMLFGKGWDRDPRVTRYWRGHLSYELLPEVYRSTKIVLDDTATPTLPYAFVNGRVFDAIASGALVLSDNVEGSAETFDGMLPTYSDSEELRAQIDLFLGDEGQRVELVKNLRQKVTSRHSYETRPSEFLQLALDHLDRPHAAIKIAVPKDDVRALWGDTHFGNAIASALTELGLPTEVHILPEWDNSANQAVDVVIHIRGLTKYAPKPAHINVLWIISHPDDVSVRECGQYDLVLVASRRYADWLRPQIDAPVVFLPQATDSRRFHSEERRDDISAEVLFVGNSRGQRRPAVDWAIDAGLPLTVYGGGWDDLIPDRFVRASHYPNSELAELYASADLVLNDHWPDMREHGFISNRVFDALASGAVVVSDRVAGLEEMFGELVPTYSDAGELQEVVWDLLKDRERRLEISRSASKFVAEQHTFTHRAEMILDLLRPLLSGRPSDLDGGVLEL